MTRRYFLLISIFLAPFAAIAGEGMWIPLLLDSLNYRDMKEKGLRLSPEEIYSTNQTSIKDAIVIFGGGCTGELISPEGLVITNHHCGYSRIQSHSTIEHDYLTNGFWANATDEELPNPGLSVTFLVRIEDVTRQVLDGISEELPEIERNSRIASVVSALRDSAISGTHYQADIKSFYFGREYYMFVYEIFNDVRLVGAPAESIGRFGGDTDNWVWPRHTGDFSLFRIYADKNNQPAEYSPDNIPYKPKKYFSISLDGAEEGDFTMVLGYPGRTDQFLTADALSMIALKSLPAKIQMRTLRLDAIQEEMATGPEARLRYASKYVNISNAWKKWIGVTHGVQRSDVVERKKQLENEFDTWAKSIDPDPMGYASLMPEFVRFYSTYAPLYQANDIGGELLNSLEVSPLINRVQLKFFGMHDSSEQYKKMVIQQIKQSGHKFFTSNASVIDRKILPALLKIFADNSNPHFHPAFYQAIMQDFKGDYQAYVSSVFNTSIFTDSARFNNAFSKSEAAIGKHLKHDPLLAIYRDFSLRFTASPFEKLDSMTLELNHLYRKYVSGLMTMNPNRVFYPDANFTLRIAYGKVEGYEPADAVQYLHYSTLDGILEKEDPEIADYAVPEQLKELYAKRDFGPYTYDGKVPVCFIASNHTSGGNSGSPVLNADGNLIGINFDRNWEGTVSDYAYDSSICRNISLDVRYVLFVIDKVADADWLLDELTIINH